MFVPSVAANVTSPALKVSLANTSTLILSSSIPDELSSTTATSTTLVTLTVMSCVAELVPSLAVTVAE